MNQILITIAFIFAVVISLSNFPEGAIATTICGILAIIVIKTIHKKNSDIDERNFLIQVFLGGLLLRAILAVVIYSFELQMSFGPDAFAYDETGKNLSACWMMREACRAVPDNNWGMNYFVGGVYWLIGANPLAIQLMSAVCGAVTPLLIYFCAQTIFANKRVSQYSALLVAFLPAMIIWSSQMLKDGFIILLLVVIITASVRLQKRFNYLDICILLFGMLGISALRFYIFYMVGTAAIGGLLLGAKLSLNSLIRRLAIFAVLGFGLMFFGMYQVSQKELETMSLQQAQVSRRGAADKSVAGSAIESEADVSTVSGAALALPEGIVTILMAPFPWQMRKATQIMLLPEMIVWWMMLPLMFIGIKYTIKHRLRESIGILFFSLILLFAYSIYQGNLGTMYRQRAQIQVFLLVFAAVGYVVWQEQKENKQPKKLPQKAFHV